MGDQDFVPNEPVIDMTRTSPIVRQGIPIPMFEDFIEAMEESYEASRGEKGDSWQDCSIEFLYRKLREEFDEVMELPGYSEDRPDELIDLALVAFMCWGRSVRNLENVR